MELKQGDHYEFKTVVTDKMVHQFAEMSGDFNPVHMDDEYAKKTRFGRRIAHGMIAGALISRTLANDLGPGGIYLGQTMRFMNPVFIGDEITIILTVSAYRQEKGIATVETLVKNQNGELCVKGEATIMTAQFLKRS